MTRRCPDVGDLGLRMREVVAPGVAVALVADGEPAWIGTHGLRRAGGADPVTAETAFWWFSMTKIATATAVMQLVESGAVSLDRPVRDYLADLTGLDPRITVRHLLNHSSGLANPMPMRWIHRADEPGPDPREMLTGLLYRSGRLRFEPGSRSSYTNVGYLVLGELIAAASGRPYTEYVVEELLRPIGATGTGFDYPAKHAATGHHPRRDPKLPLARLVLPRWVLAEPVGGWRTFRPFLLDGSAYGGLVGPIGDAAALLAVHLGGTPAGPRILAPESLAAMQRIATPGRRFDLGLGWFRPHAASRRGATYVEHLGGGAAFGAVMRIYPEHKTGVVAMANVSSMHFDHEALLTEPGGA